MLLTVLAGTIIDGVLSTDTCAHPYYWSIYNNTDTLMLLMAVGSEELVQKVRGNDNLGLTLKLYLHNHT